METFTQAVIMAFREGLEAFLIIAVLLKFLDKTNNQDLKKNVWHGTYIGIIISLIFGGLLMWLSSFIGEIETTAELWESISSLIAVALITTFIVWIIQHGSQIKKHIEDKAALNLSGKGLFVLAIFMIAREGVEVSIFAFAGKYATIPILIGILIGVGVVLLIHHSIINVKLKTIFNLTLAYLILQAGLLIGYGIHEGLSALSSLNIIENSDILTKAFDLSNTSLNHKEGIIGLPLYVLFGWYSKPEWIQFIIQYVYTISFFLYWYNHKKFLSTNKTK